MMQMPSLRFATMESSSCRAAGDRARRSLPSGDFSPGRNLDACTMTLLSISANPVPEAGTNAVLQGDR
jgi:hypothetical protein